MSQLLAVAPTVSQTDRDKHADSESLEISIFFPYILFSSSLSERKPWTAVLSYRRWNEICPKWKCFHLTSCPCCSPTELFILNTYAPSPQISLSPPALCFHQHNSISSLFTSPHSDTERSGSCQTEVGRRTPEIHGRSTEGCGRRTGRGRREMEAENLLLRPLKAAAGGAVWEVWNSAH